MFNRLLKSYPDLKTLFCLCLCLCCLALQQLARGRPEEALNPPAWETAIIAAPSAPDTGNVENPGTPPQWPLWEHYAESIWLCLGIYVQDVPLELREKMCTPRNW